MHHCCYCCTAWEVSKKDTETLEQIDSEVKQTHPDMQLFSWDTTFARSNQEALRTDPDEENVVVVEADTLFCFVKLLRIQNNHNE